jgi:glycine/D-amino acid oxidase-like deaminating enzyme
MRSLAIAGMLFMAMPVIAPAAEVDRAQAQERLQAALQEAKSRLNLSPEQVSQLEPAFRERNAAIMAIRDKHGGDTSRRARMSMFREARPVQEDYEDKVRSVLNDSQIAEWEKMRKEAKARIKEQMRSGGHPE